MFAHRRMEATLLQRTSWDEAFETISHALAVADASTSAIREVWVAGGATYRPPTVFNSFVIPSGVRLIGSLHIGDSSTSQADPIGNASILSGDFGTSGQSGTVILCDGVGGPTPTVIRFFVVSRAANHGVSVTGNSVSPVFEEITFIMNGIGTGRGGGMTINSTSSAFCALPIHQQLRQSRWGAGGG